MVGVVGPLLVGVRLTATYGICEGCHRQTYTYKQGTDNANHSTNPCMNCHDHTGGFKGAGHQAGANCKGCHNTAQGSRPAIQPEFEKKAAHIDNSWANIASTDCEKCHYEPSSDGIIRLKIWGGTTWDGSTTITYNATQKYNANQFCLGCHDSDTSTTDIFAYGTATPADINTRWSTLVSNTKNYSKFSQTNYNVVPQVLKVYNPHKFPATNDSKGVGDMTSYRYDAARTVSDTAHVACLDCHPSHGSNNVSGARGTGTYPTTYNTSTGAKGGVMILDARPSGTAQAYTKEEQMCWDCHRVGMDYRGDDVGGTPDPLNRWGKHSGTNFVGTWGTTTPFSFKQAKSFDSSHFYPDKPLTYGATGYRGAGNNSTRTNLACSTCHNPHGIATADTNAAFRLPILRGTWLTSPYIEDRPPLSGEGKSPAFYNWRTSTSATYDMGGSSLGARISPEFSLNKTADYGQGYAAGAGTGAGGYFIDENTWGTSGGWVPGGSDPDKFGYWASSSLGSVPTNRTGFLAVTIKHFDNTSQVTNDENLTLTSAHFAGLCFTSGCHTSSGIQTYWPGHAAVPGQTSGSTDWVNMFNRPWMMQMQEVGIGNTSETGTGDNWGDLTAKAAMSYTTSNDAGYKWGYSPLDPTAVQAGYHKFPCSKCHTPHSSILPRLMTTNCLDIGSASKTTIKNGTYQYPQATGTWNAAAGAGSLAMLDLPTNLTSADGWMFSVSCHADVDGPGNATPLGRNGVAGTAPAASPSPGTYNGVRGWNNVTPW